MINTICYVALGSNLGNPTQQIVQAIKEINFLPDITVTAQSRLIQTKPVGPQNQPDFINAVIEISTSLEPAALLNVCMSIENDHRRERYVRWGPRTLDLDILLYGDKVINTPALTIPHPEMLNREFVLKPLAEIAPDLILANGKSVKDQLASLQVQEDLV